MYHCLNFVTEAEGRPAAVLLRAAEACEGVEQMLVQSPGKKKRDLLNGPGKFCRSFGLTTQQNGLDLTGDCLYLEERFVPVKNIIQSTRIGIKLGTELPYRFYDGDSESISVKDKVKH